MERLALIVVITVVILFAFAFIALTYFYYGAKKKNIINHLDDKELKEEIAIEYRNFKKSKHKNEDYELYLKKKRKRQNILLKIYDVVFISVYSLIFIFVISSVSVRASGKDVFINDTAFLVIQSNSMKEANSYNTYLFDENGNKKFNDNFEKNTLITINKNKRYIDEIKLYDIICFKGDNENKKNVNIIHRVVKIDYDENNSPLFTLKGDANYLSLVSEQKIGRDKIVGVFSTTNYKGFMSLEFGFLINYVGSTLGILIIGVSIILLIIYLVMFDKTLKLSEIRKNDLIKEKSYLDYEKIISELEKEKVKKRFKLKTRKREKKK